MTIKIFIGVILIIAILSCQEKTSQIKLIENEKFEKVIIGKQTTLFKLKNSKGMICQITNDKNLNNAPIKEGFYSCALIHLANISYRLGRILDFNPVTVKFINDAQANTILTKEYRINFEVLEKV